MANIKSALKRIQIAERNRLQNKTYKSAIKTLMKKTFQSAEAYASEPSDDNLASVNTNLAAAFSKIDKAVKCKVIHKNNAARKKARLAQAIRQATPAS
ncbi:MAG: 30S ribosomal protein S20 [Synechocystis sp.]|nr:30S ribosomal protein S20 [Synechocystis sp.]